MDNPVDSAKPAFENSRTLTGPLVSLILENSPSSKRYVSEADHQALELRKSIDKPELLRHQAELEEIRNLITTPALARSLELNAESGASI